MEASPQQNESESGGTDSEKSLSPELRDKLRKTKKCFAQIERVTQLMTGYPPGHPMVEDGLENLEGAFTALFEDCERLTVQIYPHWMDLYEANETVWETQEPKDYCFALNRDGIYLLHFLDGIDGDELQRFVEVLNALIDEQKIDQDAVSLLFDAGFRSIHWEAIDESLAQLAGLESNLSGEESQEDQEAVDELFENAFDEQDLEIDTDDQEAVEGDFEIKIQNRSQRQMKLEVGSRNFLELSEEAQEHLTKLKSGFQDHNELEHRQGEVLSAVLGAKPRRKLRKGAIGQIGEVMGELLETTEPWEALAFLKLIHQWRDKFHPDVAGELKDIVKECFTERRVQILVKQLAESDKSGRRAILQMFDALGLSEASQGLAELLARDLDEEARQDIVRYVRKQSRRDLSFVEAALPKVPGDKAGPLIEILVKSMPKSRPILVELLKTASDPGLKIEVLDALRGSWEDTTEVRDYLVPLIHDDSEKVRIAAAHHLGEAAPQHVYRVLEPLFTPKLARRSEEEVGELVSIFVKKGRQKAVDRLEELVKRRGVVSEEQIELAVTVVRALIKAPNRAIIDLLESVAGDWLVAGRIRSTCKEVVELINR